MRRTLFRLLPVGTAIVAIAAAAATSAFAASTARGDHLGPRGGGFGAAAPAFGGMMGGPGFGRLPAVGGFRGGGLGAGAARAGNADILAADLLTPAASYLGIPLSTLESDLAGGKTLAQEATASGKTASGLVDAIVAAEKTVLDAEKAAGWLTDAQETNMVSRFQTAATSLVNEGAPLPPRAAAHSLIQAAAGYLGVSASDLRSALKAGKSLAGEATANGKAVDGLVQALLAPLKTKLDQQVAAGTITQAQETSTLNRLTTRLTKLVNRAHKDAGSVQAALQTAIGSFAKIVHA